MTDICTFLELLENHGVYNFRIIEKEIRGFDEMQEPLEIPPEGFDEMQEPFEIPPEGFDEMQEPLEIPPEGFDEMREPLEVTPKIDDSSSERVYTYYAAYTDYQDSDPSAGQRMFKILNLEELMSLITNDIDSLVVRGHLSLFDVPNVSSVLEEIVER